MPSTGTPGNPPPIGATASSTPSESSEPPEQRLDGNAAGGVLGAIFPFEMTMAMATCAGCGARHPVGALKAYLHGMGSILRCPACETALIRVAHIRDRYYLDLRGMRVLQLAEAAP